MIEAYKIKFLVFTNIDVMFRFDQMINKIKINTSPLYPLS
jgi:hypothetical protein